MKNPEVLRMIPGLLSDSLLAMCKKTLSPSQEINVTGMLTFSCGTEEDLDVFVDEYFFPDQDELGLKYDLVIKSNTKCLVKVAEDDITAAPPDQQENSAGNTAGNAAGNSENHKTENGDTDRKNGTDVTREIAFGETAKPETVESEKTGIEFDATEKSELYQTGEPVTNFCDTETSQLRTENKSNTAEQPETNGTLSKPSASTSDLEAIVMCDDKDKSSASTSGLEAIVMYHDKDKESERSNKLVGETEIHVYLAADHTNDSIATGELVNDNVEHADSEETHQDILSALVNDLRRNDGMLSEETKQESSNITEQDTGTITTEDNGDIQLEPNDIDEKPVIESMVQSDATSDVTTLTAKMGQEILEELFRHTMGSAENLDATTQHQKLLEIKEQIIQLGQSSMLSATKRKRKSAKKISKEMKDFIEPPSSEDDDWFPEEVAPVSKVIRRKSVGRPPKKQLKRRRRIIVDEEDEDESERKREYIIVKENESGDSQPRYKCTSCDYVTEELERIKDHTVIHKKLKHPCNDCKKNFKREGDLIRHRQTHVSATCTEDGCSEVCSSRISYKKHLTEVHSVKLYDCYACKEFFRSHEELQGHVQEVHNYICRNCGEHFTKQRTLKEHRLKVHKEDELKCQQCGRQCPTQAAFKKHMEVHKEKMHSCDLCEKTFGSQSTLYHHRKGIHGVAKPYKCDQCSRSFNFSNSLKLHMLKHSGDRPFGCKECDKTYLTANHLKNHVSAVHRQVRKYSCKVCSKNFPYENSLRMHMMLHTGSRPFLCSMCDRTFVSKSALKVHEMNHSSAKNLPCDICNKLFKSEQLLRAHRRRHTGEGSRFMCDLCGHTFMYKSNLEAHKLVHGEGRKFVCAICGKAFKTQATLYTHNAVHKTDTPWSCSQCTKAFKTKDRMLAHEKRHSGLKPFNCEQCGRCFPDKGGLTKHARTVHSDFKRYVCQMCGKACTRSDNLRVHMKTHGQDNLDRITKLPFPVEADGQMALVEEQQHHQEALLPPQNPGQGHAPLSQQTHQPSHPILTQTILQVNPDNSQLTTIPQGALQTMAPLNMAMHNVPNNMTPNPLQQQLHSGHSTPIPVYPEPQNIVRQDQPDQNYIEAANNLLIMQYHHSGFQYGPFGGQY